MSDSKRFDSVLQKFQEFKDKLSKYDEKRQDGVNVEPPMTSKEKTKKGEFLAMSKNGQWSLGKGDDGRSQSSNPPKSENRKKFEKEIKDISPTGEDPVKGAEEVDSAEIKRKYRAGAGSGASPNRLHKGEPQPGEAGHEEKEEKIAGKVKAEAEELLDMHKKKVKKMDEGTSMAGDYNMTNIEKKDLPKNAEYQQHKKEPKDRA